MNKNNSQQFFFGAGMPERSWTGLQKPFFKKERLAKETFSWKEKVCEKNGLLRNPERGEPSKRVQLPLPA